MGNIFTSIDNPHNKHSGKNKTAIIQKNSRYLFEDLFDKNFNAEEFTKELIKYLELTETKRVYYSVYSNMIYGLDEAAQGTLDTNLESLVDFTCTEKFDKLFPKGTPAYSDRRTVVRVIHKLWDHSRLAENQIAEIKKDNFFINFEKEKAKIENSIKEEGQKLNRELISLVGIFTAMAFLVFGGLNSLSAILEHSVKGVPILNISVVCLLWGLCVYNMIYLFMFLVAKITDNDISTNKSSTHIFRRHIIYFTGNAILLTALFISGWLYFIKINFRGWYTKLYHDWKSLWPCISWTSPAIVIPVIFVIIVLIFLVVLISNASRETVYNNSPNSKEP